MPVLELVDIQIIIILLINQFSSTLQQVPEHLNQGNHYSTFNHRFNAPVAGVYQFSACVIVNGIANIPTDSTDLFYLIRMVKYGSFYEKMVDMYLTTLINGYYVDFMSNVNVLMALMIIVILYHVNLSNMATTLYTWLG